MFFCFAPSYYNPEWKDRKNIDISDDIMNVIYHQCFPPAARIFHGRDFLNNVFMQQQKQRDKIDTIIVYYIDYISIHTTPTVYESGY